MSEKPPGPPDHVYDIHRRIPMHSKWTMSEQAKSAALRIFENRRIYLYSHFEALIQSAIDQVAAPKDARIAKLEAQLAKATDYISRCHGEDCPHLYDDGGDEERKCDCGTDDFLSKLSKEGE